MTMGLVISNSECLLAGYWLQLLESPILLDSNQTHQASHSDMPRRQPLILTSLCAQIMAH